MIFNLDQKTRSELRVPLDRLNQSRRHHNETEKAIDLGIALEALLLNDRERDDSIALPFRLRGAWLLGQGSTPRERKELLDIFNDLYDCRSKAVHKGTLKSGSAKYKSGKTPIEILNIGDELCVKIIEAIITNGGFHNSNEWNELLMGSQL